MWSEKTLQSLLWIYGQDKKIMTSCEAINNTVVRGVRISPFKGPCLKFQGIDSFRFKTMQMYNKKITNTKNYKKF